MSDLTSKSIPVVTDLLSQSESQLYIELAQRIEAIKRNPDISGAFEPNFTRLESLGPIDDIEDFGRRFFERISIQAYALMCGKEVDNVADRDNILKAFLGGKEIVAGTLTTLLIINLGIAPAIAPVLSALLIKLFFNSAYEVMCEMWGEQVHKP